MSLHFDLSFLSFFRFVVFFPLVLPRVSYYFFWLNSWLRACTKNVYYYVSQLIIVDTLFEHVHLSDKCYLNLVFPLLFAHSPSMVECTSTVTMCLFVTVTVSRNKEHFSLLPGALWNHTYVSSSPRRRYEGEGKSNQTQKSYLLGLAHSSVSIFLFLCNVAISIFSSSRAICIPPSQMQNIFFLFATWPVISLEVGVIGNGNKTNK